MEFGSKKRQRQVHEFGPRRPVDRRRRLLVGLALPTPFAASLPYVAASALVHVVYFLLVGRLYRNADLSPIR